jgi:flagellar motor component MotA
MYHGGTICGIYMGKPVSEICKQVTKLVVPTKTRAKAYLRMVESLKEHLEDLIERGVLDVDETLKATQAIITLSKFEEELSADEEG